MDLGGRPSVDSALHWLEKWGEIRRVILGIDDYPLCCSKLLDHHLSPDIDQVALALARILAGSFQQLIAGKVLPVSGMDVWNIC